MRRRMTGDHPHADEPTVFPPGAQAAFPGSLFTPSLTLGATDAARLTRSRDHASSSAAAHDLAPHLSRLQEEVLLAFRRHPGPLSDTALRLLPHFHTGYAESTVRKRRKELTAAPFCYLEYCGEAIEPDERGKLARRMRYRLTDAGERIAQQIAERQMLGAQVSA